MVSSCKLLLISTAKVLTDTTVETRPCLTKVDQRVAVGAGPTALATALVTTRLCCFKRNRILAKIEIEK